MKLINLKTKLLVTIDESELTAYSYVDYAILESDYIDAMFIKDIELTGTFNNYKIVKLISMTDDEMSSLVSELGAKQELQNKIESFKGYKYKLTSHSSIMDETNTFHKLYQIALAEGNDRDLIYNENGEVDYIISYWNHIIPQVLIILNDETIFVDNDENKGRMFQLEVNPHEVFRT